MLEFLPSYIFFDARIIISPIKFIYKSQVKELEKQLENETLNKEIHNLKQQLELLEEDKKELELKYQNSEEKARNLKHSGKTLPKLPGLLSLNLFYVQNKPLCRQID